MDAARVDQLALVHTYYDGLARVHASSLQLPQQAYFCDAPRSARAQERASRKRKRNDARQQELIAAGKFVPVDDSLIQALTRAHTELIARSDASTPAASCTSSPPSSAQHSHDDACTCIKALHTSQLTLDALHTNATDSVRLARTSGACDVLLPPRCAFVQTDVRTLSTHALGRFNLIVMDPPWQNKSVARGKQYATFHHAELLKIDISALADEHACVLGIWVTNRPELTTFVLETLLPAWGFALYDTWYWLKVCANSALVTPLTSSHRLPFEKLIVATRCADAERTRALSKRLGTAPKLRMSTPLRHSWKPPPESFFDTSIVPTEARKLELFARELRPNWTSIGNEVRGAWRLSIVLFDWQFGWRVRDTIVTSRLPLYVPGRARVCRRCSSSKPLRCLTSVECMETAHLLGRPRMRRAPVDATRSSHSERCWP